MREHVGTPFGKAIIVCIICLLVGLAAWICMLSIGLLGTTNLGNIYVWGLQIAIFAFLVGFGAGSQLVAAGMTLWGGRELRPYVPIAQGIGFGATIGAGVAIICDLGAPFNIMNMLMHPNPTSMLTWDMVAMTCDLIVALICLIALGRRWTLGATRVWMVVQIIFALALQVVEGFLFATQGSRAWWHSPVLVVDFVVIAITSGLAILTLIVACSKRDEAPHAARTLGWWLFGAVVAHVGLSVLEIILLATEGTGGAQMALSLIGSYWWIYGCELVLPLVAVIVLVIRGHEIHPKKIVVCSAVVIAGLFAHRLMLLYPSMGGVTLFTGLSNQPSPMWGYPASTGFFAAAHDTFQLTQAYVPSFVEWFSILLPLALAVLIALICYRLIADALREHHPAHE